MRSRMPRSSVAASAERQLIEPFHPGVQEDLGRFAVEPGARWSRPRVQVGAARKGPRAVRWTWASATVSCRMRRRAVAILVVGSVVVAGCGSADGTASKGYSVLLRRIVADANVQNQDNPFYRLATPGTKVPMSEATAARAVIGECNEGRGTRVLVAGLVTGPVTSGSPIYWAVFVDPPGKHLAPSAEPLGKPVVLNWTGAFVSVKTTRQPFCDFGRAANLPPLPVFGS